MRAVERNAIARISLSRTCDLAGYRDAGRLTCCQQRHFRIWQYRAAARKQRAFGAQRIGGRAGRGAGGWIGRGAGSWIGRGAGGRAGGGDVQDLPAVTGGETVLGFDPERF